MYSIDGAGFEPRSDHITAVAVARKIGWDLSTIYKLWRMRRLPLPVSYRPMRWLRSDIEAFVANGRK